MANKLLISSSLIKDNVMLLAAHCFEYNDMSSAFNQMRPHNCATRLRLSVTLNP